MSSKSNPAVGGGATSSLPASWDPDSSLFTPSPLPSRRTFAKYPYQASKYSGAPHPSVGPAGPKSTILTPPRPSSRTLSGFKSPLYIFAECIATKTRAMEISQFSFVLHGILIFDPAFSISKRLSSQSPRSPPGMYLVKNPRIFGGVESFIINAMGGLIAEQFRR